MMRFIMPVILIGISVTVFFMFSEPIYNDIGQLRARVNSFNKALDNFNTLDHAKDELTHKKGTFDPNDLARLQKLLPDKVDNIRLILEIGKIAEPYGMVLKDIKYNATDTTKNVTPSVGVSQGGGAGQTANRDYGIWDLEFSTTSTYNNFLDFTTDLQKNLRIVDISSIQFSSINSNVFSATSSEFYKYNFKIKTYWLKN